MVIWLTYITVCLNVPFFLILCLYTSIWNWANLVIGGWFWQCKHPPNWARLCWDKLDQHGLYCRASTVWFGFSLAQFSSICSVNVVLEGSLVGSLSSKILQVKSSKPMLPFYSNDSVSCHNMAPCSWCYLLVLLYFIIWTINWSVL